MNSIRPYQMCWVENMPNPSKQHTWHQTEAEVIFSPSTFTNKEKSKSGVRWIIFFFFKYCFKCFNDFPSAMLNSFPVGVETTGFCWRKCPSEINTTSNPMIHVQPFVKWIFKTLYKNTDDWRGHRLIHLREETLYLSLFGQVKQTHYDSSIYIHEQHFYKWAFTLALSLGSFRMRS